MKNLRRHYPWLFVVKEMIPVPDKPDRMIFHENTPTVTKFEDRIEVKRLPDSTPMVLKPDFVL